MKKSLAIALLIFFISSCSVKPEEDSTISPAQISAFSSTINDEGLFFTKILPPIPPATDPTPTAVPFRIASDGTYVDGKGVIYTMTHFINDTTVMATSVDYGAQKHSLIDGVYGVVFQEIAYTPVSPDVTADFRAKVNNKKLDSEQSGSWQRFVIPENGIYKTDNITYTITRLIGADSALVAKDTGGSEVHTLLGDEYGVFAGSTVTKDIAFKKATTGEASTLITTLGGFVKSTPTSGAWVSLDAIDTTYKLDDVTYEIGKIIDPNTILVAKSPSGVETHKIIAGTSFGPVTTPGSSSIIEKAFKKATPGDVSPFAISIVGFVDSTKWDPLPIVAGTKYTANAITYDIGKVIDATSVLVASPSGVETHKLVDKTLKNGGTELAFKKATKPEITTFFGVKELAKFVYTTPVAGKWKLLDTTGTTNYKIGSDTYEIGKINSDNTILVKKAGTDAETHILNGNALTKGTTELAFKRDVPAIRDFITGKLTDFIDSTKWNTVDVDVDGTKYTANAIIYDIGKIIGTTSVVVASPSGVETHALSAKTLKNGGTELAFKRATEADVIKFVDNTLKDFIHASDGKWNPVTATSGLASYTLRGDTYNVYKINGNTATVVIGTSTDDPASAAEDHTLLDVTNYGLNKTTPLAIRRNTADKIAITTFATKITTEKLTKKDTSTKFTIPANGIYSHDGKTYEIGRVITADDVLVAFSGSTTETHGYRKTPASLAYGKIKTDVTIDTVIAKDTRLAELKAKLKDYVYLTRSSGDAYADFPNIIKSTDPSYFGKYTVKGTTYNITFINVAINEVTTDCGTHKLFESSGQYGETITRGTEIAVKRDPDDVRDFINDIDRAALKYVENDTTNWLSFKINPDGTYKDHRRDKYTIIQVIERYKVLVVYDAGKTEMLKLEGKELKVYSPTETFTRITAVQTSLSGVEAFADTVNDLKLKGVKGKDKLKIKDDGTYTLNDGKNDRYYSIGRVDGGVATAALKTAGPTFIFKYKLIGGKYHKLKPNSSTESEEVMAE